MSVPSGGPPHETALRVATAGDSVVPIRYVLGTAPVEADGSAHFTVPANKELAFQAVDENGLAVQSMRSATYLHEGERLACMGCHEPKHRSPEAPKTMAGALALRRAPSPLKPDVDGQSVQLSATGPAVSQKPAVNCTARPPWRCIGREPLIWYICRFHANLMPMVRRYGDGVAHPADSTLSVTAYQLRRGHPDEPPEDLHGCAVARLHIDVHGVREEGRGCGEIVQPTLNSGGSPRCDCAWPRYTIARPCRPHQAQTILSRRTTMDHFAQGALVTGGLGFRLGDFGHWRPKARGGDQLPHQPDRSVGG
jgi:hypothetical protein